MSERRVRDLGGKADALVVPSQSQAAVTLPPLLELISYANDSAPAWLFDSTFDDVQQRRALGALVPFYRFLHYFGF